MQEDVKSYFVRHAVRFNDLYGGDNTSTKIFDKLFRKPMYTRFEWTIEEGSRSDVDSVLDLGCGSGRYAIAFARNGKEVTGVDFSEKMLELSREYSETSGTSEKTDFHQADINAWMEDTEKRFDLSIGMGLFDYLTSPADTLRKMLKVSKVAIVSFPAPTFPRSQIRSWRYRAQNCPIFFFTEKDIQNLANEAGAEVTEIRSLNGAGYWVKFSAKSS